MRISRNSKGLVLAGCLLGLGSPPAVRAQPAADDSLPRIVQKDGRYALMVDGAPYLMLGAQIHNSSAWPGMMPKVWPALDYLHVNTAEMPVYWEQIEPAQGQFDFSVVDTLLKEAREHKVHLVLLWFGTWKNGSSHYMPEWMKQTPEKYPNITGRNGKWVDSPSPHCEAAMELDKSAFSNFMGHLKSADPQHTVLMVQVENEPGAWGSVRDFSPAAQKIFESPVPPELLKALNKQASATAAWQEVFGDNADEYFHAWSVAHYIQQVAAAGKAVYPLPLYVNAALRDPINPGKASTYESGGATDNVLPIWKAAAPAIDVLAPDIYISDSTKVLKVMELYHRADNPLMVPEIGNSPEYARYFFAALGNQTIGYSPFGLDYSHSVIDSPAALAQAEAALTPMALNYQAIGPMQRQIARWNFEGKVQAAVQREDGSPAVLTCGKWNANISFGGGGRQPAPAPAADARPVGRILVAQLAENEFIVTGFYSRVAFRPNGDSTGKPWQFMKVEEGQYDAGVFKPIRIWNGDETDNGLNFTSAPQVLHVTLSLR